MSKGKYIPGKLVTIGSLISELHYGPFLRDWWYFSDEDSNIYPIPLRLGFQVSLKLNQKYFTVRIVRSLYNSNVLGFICVVLGVNSIILLIFTIAIINVYK